MTPIERECRRAWFDAEIEWLTLQLNPHDPVHNALLLFRREGKETRHLPERQRIARLNNSLRGLLANLEKAQKPQH